MCRRRAVALSLTFPIQCAHFASYDAKMPSVALLLLFCLGSCCCKPCNSGRMLSYKHPSQGFPAECLWLHATIPVLAYVVPSLKERDCWSPQPLFFFSFSLSFSPRKWHHAYFNSEWPDISWPRNGFKVGFHKTAELCSDTEGSQFNSLNR